MELKDIKKIGPKRLEGLRKLNITDINDLVFYSPNYYEDRKTLVRVKDLDFEKKQLVHLKIVAGPARRKTASNMTMVSYNATDGERPVEIVFFNQSFAVSYFKKGLSYYIFGKPSIYNNRVSFSNPIFSQVRGKDLGVIVPIYPLNATITNKILRESIKAALDNFTDIRLLPDEIVKKYNFLSIKALLRMIHFPEDIEKANYAIKSMAYVEAFLLNVMKYSNFSFTKKSKGKVIRDTSEERDFLRGLPFLLTEGQKAAIVDIKRDLEADYSMNRLLQGDVGSGKTVVGQYMAIKTVAGGRQVAFMAPTTLLAVQNYEKLKTFADKFNMNCELLISKTKKKDKERIYEEVQNGNIDILVGTHSLLNEDINFKDLGSVIIDEQHRFGVNQRNNLIEKGNGTNVLVMSATPIPRSLSIILYGDMDISEIKTMPEGRQKIDTYVLTEKEMDGINGFVGRELQNGRQAYYVCPLIEESEKSDLNSATELYERLKEEFTGKNVALLTGRTDDEEKEKIMTDFKDGLIDVLVSTTVIEVGIDVPNATTIVIMNGERFGLAQLHQLRGRVGRGQYKSTCIISHNAKNDETYSRLKTIERSNDGFYIAMEDLKQRGPGEILGLKQSGAQKFKFLDFETDLNIVMRAKNDFDEYIKNASEAEVTELKNNAELLLGKIESGVLN